MPRAPSPDSIRSVLDLQRPLFINATCPSRQELTDFALGALPAEQSETLADHLEDCATCETVLEALHEPADRLVSRLRSAGAAPEAPEPPILRATLDAIAAIRHEPSFLAGDAPTTSAVSLAGDVGTVGVYRLLSKLGEGGMGAVYKALHTHLDKVVALKILPAERMTPAAVARFQREMRAVGKLEHPNIVRAMDAGEHQGRYYLVMEHVVGNNLAEIVGRLGPLPIADACEITRQAAVGLQHAHEHGLVHRDIKPSNLMLSQSGQVKILDLGLALLHVPQADDATNVVKTSAGADGIELTGDAQIMGTADYMAPEQAESSHRVDIRADIYALGCTLYKLLAGEAPFAGGEFTTPLQKLMAHASHAIPPLKPRRPETPAALAEALHRMLAKQPADRYATPADAATALAPFCAGADPMALAARIAGRDPVEARATDSLYPPNAAAAYRSRSVKWLALAAAAAFLLLAAIVVRLVTSDGTLVITVDDPRALVVIDGRQVQVTRSGDGRTLTISVERGTHDLAVTTPEGLKFTVPHRFEMSAGGRKEVSAVLEAPTEASRDAPTDAPAPAIAPFEAAQAHRLQNEWAAHLGVPVEWENSIGMRFILIPPGEFTMGSTVEEIESVSLLQDNDYWKKVTRSSGPAHRVRLTQPFFLGIHEVTQRQYARITGANPAYFSEQNGGRDKVAGSETSQHPVDSVTFENAAEFCRRLNERERFTLDDASALGADREAVARGYRIPTEAEWEFACRAGTTTAWSVGDQAEALGTVAWCRPNAAGATHSVGRLKPNAWGLYDMHGNVWEWVRDWHHQETYKNRASPTSVDPQGPSFGTAHVLRGGSWGSDSAELRAASRALPFSNRQSGYGFRAALTVAAVRAAIEMEELAAPASND